MPDLIGRKLGKYELVERLGRGGMAEVYKAFQPGVERHVAIKVMHGHLSDSPEFVQRFQREARSIGQLQHPHIGRVIDFDVEADVYYMVMDYIQGGTLDEYLTSKGTLPIDEAVRITLQLADALAYAHQRGMVHRDIKPGNIMFMDDAHTHALLTDFGIARLLDEQNNMTMTGALVGTPNYMSPEAARGEPCDARADIYSLGVVFYELVTGRTPYAADTPYSFLMKQANEPLPPPRTLNPNVPTALEAVLLKALAKEPKARYQNATELATALRSAQASSATAPGSLPMQQPNPSRAPLALAGLGVLVVAIVTVLSLLRLGGSTPEATPALAPTATTAEVVAAAPATDTPTPTLAPTATAGAVAVTETLTETSPSRTRWLTLHLRRSPRPQR
ncbi:MAG: protein kinase [Caldilineaceae bacterium]